MSDSGSAMRYERATANIKSDGGSGAHLYHMATFLRCHSAPPPAVEEYAAWLALALSDDPRCNRGRHPTIDAKKLRRAVVMRRNGSTIKEIGASIGLGLSAVKRWLGRLPDGLAA